MKLQCKNSCPWGADNTARSRPGWMAITNITQAPRGGDTSQGNKGEHFVSAANI